MFHHIKNKDGSLKKIHFMLHFKFIKAEEKKNI